MRCSGDLFVVVDEQGEVARIKPQLFHAQLSIFWIVNTFSGVGQQKRSLPSAQRLDQIAPLGAHRAVVYQLVNVDVRKYERELLGRKVTYVHGRRW